MSAYYKKIKGKSYDKTMLDIADRSIAGKGDGRISIGDSRSIVNAVKDGGKITDIEKRTLSYILENYKLTDSALKHIEKSLSDRLDVKDKKNIKSEIEMKKNEDVQRIKDETEQGGGIKKIVIAIIVLLLALFSFFIFFKYFYKNKSENFMIEKHDQISALPEESKPSAKTEKDTALPVDKKNEVKPEKQSDNHEYIVKENDTLIKISESVFGDYRMWKEIFTLNKSKVTNPTILFPGQVLIMPEKKGMNNNK